MTRRERRELQRLRVRVEELEREREKQFEIYRNQLNELVAFRIALRNTHDCLAEAVVELNPVIRDFDRISPRLEVEK